MKLELASGLRVLLEQKKLKIPNNKKLIMQLNGLHYQVSKTGNMVFESPEKDKLHDDYLWALVLVVLECDEVMNIISRNYEHKWNFLRASRRAGCSLRS